MLNCCCTTKIEYVPVTPDFDNPPERIEQSEPETVQDLVEILVYYEELISTWESWGISVYKSAGLPIPEGLKLGVESE